MTEVSFTNAMRITWVIMAALAVMLMILNGRLTTIEESITFINDESLHILQNNIDVVNNNIIATNDNIEILQYNLYDKINTTCVGD